MNAAPALVSALVLCAGEWEPPRPHSIRADGEVFVKIVGTPFSAVSK